MLTPPHVATAQGTKTLAATLDDCANLKLTTKKMTYA